MIICAEEAGMFAFPQKLLSRVSASMSQWRRGRFMADHKTRRAEVEGADEIERLARETGISIDDLRILAMLGIHGADLLRRRMHILRVDPDKFYRSEPATFRELQKSCSACESHGRCALDLARDAIDPTRPDWRDYCPNAAMLNMLSAVENCYRHQSLLLVVIASGNPINWPINARYLDFQENRHKGPVIEKREGVL